MITLLIDKLIHLPEIVISVAEYINNRQNEFFSNATSPPIR